MKTIHFTRLTIFAAVTLATLFESGTRAHGERLPTVTTQPLTRKDVTQVLTLSASLKPYEQVALHAKVNGYLEAIHVDIGDRVKKGDVLAELSVPEMATQRKMAEAELHEKQAQTRKAEAFCEMKDRLAGRLSDLQASAKGSVTDEEVEIAKGESVDAQADRAVCEAAVEVAKAKLNNIDALVAYARISAPFDGIVTRRFVDTGALVTSGSSGGGPLVELSRVDKLRLAMDIPERVAAYVGKGHKLGFTFSALPSQTFEGTITRTSGVLAEDTRSMRVEVDLMPQEGLRPGMYATVELPFREFPNVFTVPAKIVRYDEGVLGVFVVERDVVAWVPVKRLHDDGKDVVVESVEEGRLKEGDALVHSAPSLLQAGQQITVQGAIGRQ